MKHHSDKLTGLLAPLVAAMGYELLGVEWLPQRRGSLLRLYIDSERGITLEDCEAVSRQAEGVLDVEDPIQGEYTLEVSSPGLDRPLFTLEHFSRFCGEQVRVHVAGQLDGRRRLSGLLKAVEGEDILIVENNEEYRVAFSSIEKARLIA